MSVEFIGMIGTQPASEIHPPRGPAIDVDYVRQFAQAHEQSGFDRILDRVFLEWSRRVHRRAVRRVRDGKARPDAGASPRLRGADRCCAQAGDARSIQRRPARSSYHLGRRRRRTAQGWRFHHA